MGARTKIQWVDDTVNPTAGCDGCELRNLAKGITICYAGAITDRFGETNPGLSNSFETVVKMPGRMAEAAKRRDLQGKPRLKKPWMSGLPRLIFVSDMADALSKAIDFEYLRDEIIANVTSELGRRHHWLWLTKQPARMAQFSDSLRKQGIPWPSNLWAGTSVTTQKTTTRIGHLLKVGDEHTIHFVSVEPQWEPIDLSTWLPKLDWIIQGGESGSSAKPFDTAWAMDMIRKCRDAGVAYFLKQLGSQAVCKGERLSKRRHARGDWSEWKARLRVRKFPINADGSRRKKKA